MASVKDMKVGECAIVEEVDASMGVAQRLMSFGLLPGVRVRLVGVAPMGDPVALELPGQRLSLRREDAACVLIAKVERGRG